MGGNSSILSIYFYFWLNVFMKNMKEKNWKKCEAEIRIKKVSDCPGTNRFSSHLPREVTCLWEKASSLMTGENTEEEAFRGPLDTWIFLTVAHWAIMTINPFFNMPACCTLRLVTEVINQHWLCAKVNMSYDHGKGASGNKPLFRLL